MGADERCGACCGLREFVARFCTGSSLVTWLYWLLVGIVIVE